MANYSLKDNPLTADPNDKLAQLEGVKSYSQDGIIDRMLKRGTSLTKTDMLAALNAFNEEVIYITEEGGTVSTPLFSTSLSISGVFANADDTFDPKRHSLNVNSRTGSALKEAAQKIKLTKVPHTINTPWITGVRDTLASENAECKVSAGNVIELTGAHLKFDNTDTEQGVFFVNDAGEIRCTKIVDNKDKRTLFVLPLTVAAGEYKLEVRSKVKSKSADNLKAVRAGTFERFITVV